METDAALAVSGLMALSGPISVWVFRRAMRRLIEFVRPSAKDLMETSGSGSWPFRSENLYTATLAVGYWCAPQVLITAGLGVASKDVTLLIPLLGGFTINLLATGVIVLLMVRAIHAEKREDSD